MTRVDWKTQIQILIVAAFILSVTPASNAAEIEGVSFPDEIQVSDAPALRLKIFGTGLLRYRIVFRGYVAALYLPGGATADQALTDVPRRLELSYFWSIAGNKFGEAADQLLERELEPSTLASLRDRLDQLHQAYRDIQPGDRYALTYIPGTGTELRLNNEPLVSIPGEDFARAYFGIWLGNQPLDKGLRDDLLRRG